MVAATIHKRIGDRLTSPSIAAIASVYTFTGAEKITAYGAMVEQAYKSNAWTLNQFPDPSAFLPVEMY